jgi:hypothetical protein
MNPMNKSGGDLGTRRFQRAVVAKGALKSNWAPRQACELEAARTQALSTSVSEGQPQPDADRSAAINPLLWSTDSITTEVRVRKYVLRENDRISILV